MATAGWYPDPSGQPQLFRYWDGQSWSEQLTSDPSSPPPGPAAPPPPAAPTQLPPAQQYPQQQYDPYQQQGQQQYPPQTQPGQYGAGGYGGQQPPYPGAPGGGSGGGSGKRIALIAIAVLVVVALGIGSFFVVSAASDDDGDEKASDDSSQSDEPTDESESPTDESESPTESPTDESQSPTDTPGNTYTGDPCAGGLPNAGGEVASDGEISGGNLSLPPVRGFDKLQTQLVTTFQFADGIGAVYKQVEEQWIALYSVGGLPKNVGFTNLADSADQVINCMTESPNFYRSFSGRTDLDSGAIEVDGHEAYSITTEIRVEDPQVQVEGDHARVIVVDTGDEDRLGVYISVVPIGNQKLISQQDAATEQLQVDD